MKLRKFYCDIYSLLTVNVSKHYSALCRISENQKQAGKNCKEFGGAIARYNNIRDFVISKTDFTEEDS